MKASIVSIGNSKGVRIPKALLQQCNFTDTVHLEVKEDKIILSPIKQAREGWEEAAKHASNKGDDELLIPDSIENDFDKEEWQW